MKCFMVSLSDAPFGGGRCAYGGSATSRILRSSSRMAEYLGARESSVTSTTAETHSFPHVAFQNGTRAV